MISVIRLRYLRSDNSSGRSAIYHLPTRKLLPVDRIFIYGFVSLISVVTVKGNPQHFKSILPVVKPTDSYLITQPVGENPNTTHTMRMTSSKCVLQQRHLLCYELEPIP